MSQLTRILFAVIYCVILTTEINGQDSISQISPKSLTQNADTHENIKSSFALELEDKISTVVVEGEEEVGEQIYTRVERSASPIVNDAIFSDNKLEAEKQFGRYMSIDPTATSSDDSEANLQTRQNNVENFLGVRGRQARQKNLMHLSRPLLNNSALPMENANNLSHVSPSVSRQQNNPDIQDIITGIVNLLNGNVNVHSNGQGNRRPINNRINNRGPPRISEAQVPTNDENSNHNQNVPVVPFERPENSLPVRPFLTGVPLPEQIVPSMQQNLRPGFISQNRPPWKRPNPRPSNTFHRRPILHQQPQQIPIHYEGDKTSDGALSNNKNKNLTSVLNNNHQNEIGINNLEEEEDEQEKEEEYGENEPTRDVKNEILPTTVVTIIQSTSEVNTIQKLTDSSEIINTLSNGVISSSSTLESSFTNDELSSSSSTSSISSNTMTNTPVITSLSSSLATSSVIPSSSINQFHPRPGVVLDDPEFKPGQKNNNNHNLHHNHYRPSAPSQQHPDGIPEIFDVTLSAIQGPSGNIGSQQTINIKPFNYDASDVLLTASGDQGFVSIDGKRTYINLLGESTNAPTNPHFTSSHIQPTKLYQAHEGVTGTGHVVVAETEQTTSSTTKKHPFSQHQQNNRPITRPKFPASPLQQPSIPVRIDTCIVGDDSTCDQTQNEKCKTENGVSSCNCKPGYARRKHREPCRKIVSLVVSLRVDRFRDHKINWDPLFNDSLSEPYRAMKYESFRAIDTAMSMTPFSDEFMDVTLNNIYQGDASKGMAGVFLNLTLMIEESIQTMQPTIRNEIQRHLIGVIHRRNNNIGNSALYVDSPPGSVSAVQDLNECLSNDLNDCHNDATCTNVWGTYTCQCNSGFKDPNSDRPHTVGRECLTCSDSVYCNNRGTCSYDKNGNHVCTCISSYYGSACEIDGEVLAVAVGASIAAIIIIILTLICLIMWSRKWQREHKNAMIGSPVFGYMGAQVKTPVVGPPMTYQVSLEDRMRWAQIADVMAQANHYAAEPVAAITRPSSAMFPAYHSTFNGGMTLQHHHNHHTMNNTLHHPPVPLPRLGIRSNGARTLENSSSSEEEDRIDLLGRNFQVPRPKSRSNTSLASAIYYDVDYLPSGGGGEHIYGTTTTTNTSQIPLSTYGAPSSTTYYK